MALAVFIDSVDGSLARLWQVQRYAPQIDGRRLDDMVDYFTWVIVPIFALVHWGLIPPIIWALPLLCSALGMAHQDAKTEDDFFLGFPSLWNIVALYLWLWNLPPALNGAIVFTLSLTVLLPIRFLYPSKTRSYKKLNLLVTTLWGILVVLGLASTSDWAHRCFLGSSFCLFYYFGLSFWLHSQDKGSGVRNGPDSREESSHES